jgi:peptidoglycan/xylan/chitin deacetylase (PgdA/CDA1 family)
MPNPRVAFQLADERPGLPPPEGKPLIVHVVVNVESWRFDQPMPRKLLTSPHGADAVPDVPNFSWVEYGLRVGMPRLFALFKERRLPVSAFINAAVCDDYPRLAERVAEAQWEVVGHGYWQRSLQSEGGEERQVIDKSLERLKRFFGVRPRGWLGPGLKESLDTPDHLKAAGIDYVCDWVIDDLPNWMETRHGPLICMPYTLELNDSTLYAVQEHPSDAFHQRMRDSLATFDRELAREPRILTLALHPHLVAVPHRMVYLERMIDELAERNDAIFMTGSGIADWFVAADAALKAK